MVKDTRTNSLIINKLTKEQYDSIPEKDPLQLYFVTDDEQSSSGASRNIGDIFYTTRLDATLNGAVECNGATYDINDFVGEQTIEKLLTNGLLPYVSLSEYETSLSTYGSVRCFGYDVGGTIFRVPTLNDVYIKAGTTELPNEFNVESLPNITGSYWDELINPNETGSGAISVVAGTPANRGIPTGNYTYGEVIFNASNSNSTYQDNAKVNPNNVRYRAMIQITNGVTDESLINATNVLDKLNNNVVTLDTEQTITAQKTFNTTNDKAFSLICNDIDSSIIPESDVHQGVVAFLDKNLSNIGYLFAHNLASGNQQIGFQSHRTVDNSEIYSTLAVGINELGKKFVNFGQVKGTNYFRIPTPNPNEYLQICWGSAEVTDTATFTFPVPFTTLGFVGANMASTSGTVTLTISSRTTSSFKVKMSNTSTKYTVFYFAIGYRTV